MLKRKADALTVRFRQILSRIHEAKIAMGQLMKAGAFALAELNFAAGDVSYGVREGVTTANYKLKPRVENVSGVQLPVFEAFRESSAGGNNSDLTGLSRGGQQAQKCRDVFSKALDSLVQLASLQVHTYQENNMHP